MQATGEAVGVAGMTAARVEEVSEHLSRYLHSYASLSVQVLGRWPAYVPENERRHEALAQAGALSPPMPPHLARPGGANEASAGGGGGGGGGGSGAGSASAGDDGERKTDAAERLKLQGMVDKLSDRLRNEVQEKTKALQASSKNAAQLAQLQREHASLQETTAKQTHQLAIARDQTLRLEEEVRAANLEVDAAEARAVKDRKAKHIAGFRLEKLQANSSPMSGEHAQMSAALQGSEEARKSAEARAARGEAAAKASAAKVAQLQRRVEAMHDTLLAEREGRAGCELQLTLLGDRADEMQSGLEDARDATAATSQRLSEEAAARAAATRAQQAEAAARAAAEEAARAARAAQQAAQADAADWRRRAAETAESLEASLLAQGRLENEDRKREFEQAALFTAVAELIARTQYLGAIQPEELGMGATELYAHRDDAIRQLRALREAHALSAAPAQLRCGPTTVAVGAALLTRAAVSPRTPRAPPPLPPQPPGAWPPPPPSQPNSARRNGRKGGGGGGTPRAAACGGGDGGGGGTAAPAAAVPPLRMPARPLEEAAPPPGYEEWRGAVATKAKAERRAVGKAGRGTPRDPAQTPRGEAAGEAGGGKLLIHATEWEKQKLIELMGREEDDD